jgi:hypothetical protein
MQRNLVTGTFPAMTEICDGPCCLRAGAAWEAILILTSDASLVEVLCGRVNEMTILRLVRFRKTLDVMSRL